MMIDGKLLCGVVALALAGTGLQARAQMSRMPSGSAAVTYLYPEQVSVPAGKLTTLPLHFRIAQGLHINSHAPHQDFLIPTDFSIPAGTGVKLENARYPAGIDIALPADPKTKLSVYTGEFTIEAHVVAARGEHLLQGKLRYQACNREECMPPRTATVAIDVVGK